MHGDNHCCDGFLELFFFHAVLIDSDVRYEKIHEELKFHPNFQLPSNDAPTKEERLT